MNDKDHLVGQLTRGGMEWEPGIALQYPSLPPLYPTLPMLALATLNHHTIVPIIRILEYCMVPCGGCGAGDG